METGKQGFVGTPAPVSSVSAQREDRMHGLPRPLTAVYLQPHSAQDALTFPLSLQAGSKPFLTLHVAGGMPLQPQGHQRAGVTVPTARPKSAGKHVCRYCGRDCLKPSVLEKHLRCHTGERPYPCTVCGVAFKTQSNLYKHKRTQAHARLSCDSERDSVSSQESMQGSRDSCWTHPTPEAPRDRPDSFERETPVTATGLTQNPAVQGKVGSDTSWALQQAALVGLILAPVDRNQEKLCSIVQKVEQSSGTGPKLATSKEESLATQTPNRHLPLQRQVATLFSKKWDPRALVGKSQSHDSTDSGFSESSEQPWTSSQHDHSMESLTESSVEEPVDQRPHQVLTDTPSNGAKSQVSVLEKKKLEERISKLISENNALVDDKRLETVRPRKTVLSKQGSIDLPMPYTYKDSFHFEMKAPDRSERKAKQALYNSVPTQLTNSPEHTPLVRSSSLPFSASSSGSKRTSLPSVYQQEAVLLGRWGSSGQIDPSLLARSVDQPASHHRSLVRQKAVDCLPAAEGLSVASSTEESFPKRLGLEGESVDAESSSGKCRRKKAQKFSYNKWYMYGGGTFTKLYSMDKSSDRDTCKAKKPVISMGPEKAQEIQDKNVVIVRERGISGVTTVDLRSNISDIESSYHPPHLSVHLPSGGNMQEPSKLTSTKSFLQNPVRKDLTVSMQQCLGKIQVSSNSKEIGGGAVKDVSQEEQSRRLLPPQFINDLPSERKKQRTDESMCKLVGSVDKEGKQHNVLSHVFGANATHGENQLLPAIQIGTTQKYSNRTAQNNSSIQQNKRTDFNLCSIDLHLNQKYFQLKEHNSSLYQDNLRKQSASTESSFLPKYQLKLPQPMDSGTITSFLPSASAESHMAISTLTSTESHSATSTTGSTKGHRDTLCLASLESAVSTPTLVSLESNMATPTPASLERKIATPTQGSLESDTVTSTPTSLESHTATPIPVSMESDVATPTLASLESDTTMSTSTSLESDTAMPTPDLLESHAATPIPASAESKNVTPTLNSAESYNDMTTSSCDNANIRFSIGESSTSSYVPQSEGKVTFLIETSQIATEDVGFVKGQTGDIQIFLQVISCEELLSKETQLNAQDAKQAVSCPDISPTEAEIPEANIQNVSTILHPKYLVCQDTPHSLCTAQKSVSKDVSQSVPRGRVFTSESAVPSTHVGWRAFSPTDSHQNQNQNNGEPSYSESANLNNQASSSQIKNTDDCQDRPADQRTESLVLRSDPDKPNSARQETQIHNQGGPTDQEGVLSAKCTVSPCEEGHQDVLSISMEKCAPAKLVEKWDNSESAEPTVGPSVSQPAPIQAAPHHSPSCAVSTDRSTWVTAHSLNDNPKAIFLLTQEPPHLKAQKHTGRSEIAVTGHKHRPPPSPHSSKTRIFPKCLDGTITTRQAPLQSKPPSTGLGNKETTAVKGKGGQGALSMEPLPSTSASELQSLAGKPASTDRLKDDCDLTKPTVQRHACLRTDLAGPLGEHGSGTQIQKCPLSTKQETPLPTAGQEVSVSAAQRDTAAAPLCKTERKLPEVPLHGGSTETFLLGSSAAPKVSLQELDSAVPPGQHQHSLASDTSPSPLAALETSSGAVLLQARLANQRIPSSASDLKTNCDQQLFNKVIDLGETEPERVHLVHADIHKERALQSGEPGPEPIQPKAHGTPSETDLPLAGQAVGASQPARGPTRCAGIEYGDGMAAERRETELNYRGPTPQCVLAERSDNAATSRCLGNTREASQGLDTGLLQRVFPSTSTPLKEWRSMGLGMEHGCGRPELGGQRNDALGNSEVDQGATKGVQKEGGTRTESPVSGGMEEPGRGGLLTTPFSLWQREGVATEERPKVDETNTCRHCGTSTLGLQSPAPNETKARQAQDETGTIHTLRSKASVQGEANGSCALGPSATSETSAKRSLRFPLRSDAKGFCALQLSDKGASAELCKNRLLAFNPLWDRMSCQMENLLKIPSSSAGRGERDPLDVHSPDGHRPPTISCTPGIPPLSLDLNRLVGEVGVTGPTTSAGVDSAPGMGNLLPHDRTSTRPTWTSLRSHLPFPPSANSALSPALSCVRTRGLEEAPARAGKGDQEGEADSSSSDDEGKLVIELE